MITPTVPWVRKENKINDLENKSSKLDKNMKALVIINFNTIHRD